MPQQPEPPAAQTFPEALPPLRVALLGNPNTGKTTLFNRLTGLRQKVGNYPGITVERKTGTYVHGCRIHAIDDLPGTYSLAAASPDERVVIDALTGHLQGEPRPDAILCVLDATNLKRHLFLAFQAADLGIPMVMAINMMDAAEERGITVDCARLSQELGIPVVPVSAARDRGIDELKAAIWTAIGCQFRMLPTPWPTAVEAATDLLAAACPPGVVLDRPELRRILFDTNSAIPRRTGWPDETLRPALSTARQLLRQSGRNPSSIEAVLHHERINRLLAETLDETRSKPTAWQERLDAILTHRLWGSIAFAAAMVLLFAGLYSFAAIPMGWIEDAQGRLLDATAAWPWLTDKPMLSSLVSDGIIGGVGGVIIFLPQILILFLLLSILEDSGYLARGAYLADRLLRWSGLNGKSFVPLLSGFACAIPAAMATRTIEHPRARLATLLATPFMSCSARLPVYMLLIGALIEPRHGSVTSALVLMALYGLGLAVALPSAWALNKLVFKTRGEPLILELPPYRRPRVRDVTWRMWLAGKDFLGRAGTVIFCLSIIMWALSYFPRPESVARETAAAYWTATGATPGTATEGQLAELAQRTKAAYMEQSFLGQAGRAIQPLFAPAGFDWKITVAVLASFPAREVFVSTLGTLHNLGNDTDEQSDALRERLADDTWTEGPLAGTPVFTIPVALGIMVFFALCQQCLATLATIARESNWRWALASFAYMTLLAWLGSVACNQVGSLLTP